MFCHCLMNLSLLFLLPENRHNKTQNQRPEKLGVKVAFVLNVMKAAQVIKTNEIYVSCSLEKLCG